MDGEADVGEGSRLAELDHWQRLLRAEAEPVEWHLIGVQRPLH